MLTTPTSHPGFPTTRYSWIDDRLERGEDGEREVIDHIMQVYGDPLVTYAGRSRRLGWDDPQDLVNEFLADGLQRPHYVQRWRTSGIRPLRVWLINGLHFQYRKLLRQDADEKQRRENFAWDEASCWSRVEASPFEELVRSWRERIIELAFEHAKRRCEQHGQLEGWQDFEAHRLHGETYRSIAERTQRTPAQVEVRARAGMQSFRRELHALLDREGIPRSQAAGELIDAEL